MESLRLLIKEHMASVGEDLLCVLEKQQRGADDSVKINVRVFVLERLSVAADVMCNLFQMEIVTIETQLERQNKLLDAVLQPQIKLHRADLTLLPVCKEEVFPEQEERSPSLVQVKLEPPQIKEEQKERSVSLVHVTLELPQQEELLQRPQEAAGSLLTLLEVEREVDDENTEAEPLSEAEAESEDDREREPLASTSTQHMNTQADVEQCGTPQRTDQLLSPLSHSSESDITEDSHESHDWSSHCSESNAEDSDWEPGDAQSALNALKSHKPPRVKGQKLSHKMKLSKQTGKRSFCCTVCGKVSRSNADLIKHRRTHTGEKPFACSFCSKSFNDSGNLNKHMRTHTGEKPFACSVCNRSFSNTGTLKTHMRTHTRERPFACSVCSKSFMQSENLKKHMRIHTGEKPFACSVCGRSFNNPGNMKRHMMTHRALFDRQRTGSGSFSRL